MKKRVFSGIVFICSLFSLIVSVVLFYKTGIFADEFNTSPTVICGGEFWLVMDWLRLGVLLILSIISGIGFLSKE